MKTLVILAERLDNSAQDVLARLLEPCIDSDVYLDGSGVRMIGGRCLEILLSARRTAQENNLRFSIHSISDEFSKCLSTFGVAPAVLEARGIE